MRQSREQNIFSSDFCEQYNFNQKWSSGRRAEAERGRSHSGNKTATGCSLKHAHRLFSAHADPGMARSLVAGVAMSTFFFESSGRSGGCHYQDSSKNREGHAPVRSVGDPGAPCHISRPATF